MNALDKLTKARAGLVLDMPFFGALALRLMLKEDVGCPTAWTDGRWLGYNPEFIAGLSLAETKGLVAHEVMHCAMHHQLRRDGREPRKWNTAGDYAINAILDKSKVTLPKGRLLDTAFDSMSAEAIYSKLPDQPDGGSGDPGGCGEVRDATDADGKPAGEAEVQQQTADWKIATAQAAQQARNMGQMPAELDRLVKEIVDAKVDWRETLRRFVQQAMSKDDYRWSPPNRRHVHNGLYLPSLRGDALPPIVVAVDTSGSIDQDTLAQFAGELTSILESYNTECGVIYCDAVVQGIENYTRDDLPVVLDAKGGGGTDFRPPFELLAAEGNAPACVVYLTDMQGTFPDSEPAWPVLWVNTGPEVAAPFGEVVKI